MTLGLGLVAVIVGVVLIALYAFGLEASAVHLGWLGAAVAFLGLKLP